MKKPVFLMLSAFFVLITACKTHLLHVEKKKEVPAAPEPFYLQDPTRDLVSLVKAAGKLVSAKGEKTFAEFRVTGSQWRKGENYIFVLDTAGNMLVHADPELEGKNQLNLKDINGKPVIRGLIEAATSFAGKSEGWYHYQWTIPGELFPRWKSSFVELVQAPSGKKYIVGSGMYNNRMEKEFVVDMVKEAVGQIEKDGKNSFPLFHDPSGPFMVKEAYIFVLDMNGVELVNPAFPNLEGRNVLNLKDTRGKFLVQEMLKQVQAKGSGWVNYMWPKPGESIATLKSAYVSKARIGDQWVMVGSGVYLADAQKDIKGTEKMTADELVSLVKDAAQVLEKSGEKAFPDFKRKGSKWFHDDTYFFVWSLDGVRVMHAANPASEGENVSDVKDVHGRPWGKMLLETAKSKKGEGWVHYMYPEPGDIFPTWKSSFVKRVKFPSGKQYLVGCGIYNMDMNKTFIEDVVNRAASLVEENGKGAFGLLRDKTGPFVFLDTYVFVDNPEGLELVNGGQPGVEGRNLMGFKDAKGKLAVKEYIDTALKNDNAWVDYYWYKPGEDVPLHKHTFVRKVQSGNETYIIGAGFFPEQ